MVLIKTRDAKVIAQILKDYAGGKSIDVLNDDTHNLSDTLSEEESELLAMNISLSTATEKNPIPMCPAGISYFSSHTIVRYFQQVLEGKHQTYNNKGQKRGMLTERVQDASLELMGYEINVRELRLMPYIQYCMVNKQKIEVDKINAEEREILSKWRKKGYIEGGASEMKITYQFWLIINEIIMLGYVDLE